ncbi:DELLA protein GAIP-B [Rosa chinensis]|nr:DELLA protein GAIP-B [Rosa chinensis]
MENKSLSPRTQFEDCSSSNYDLKAIPGKTIFNKTQFDSSPRDPKRLKPSSDFSSTTTTFYLQPVSLLLTYESTRSVVVVDSQENGVRLVHGLHQSTFEGTLREQQALLELEDTLKMLRREKEVLRNMLSYLT